MFDLITGAVERPFQDRRPGSTVASALLHVGVSAGIAIPLLLASGHLPPVPELTGITAFVAPPPPPALPAPATPSTETHPRARASGALVTQAPAPAAPVEVPRAIEPEPPAPPPADTAGGQPGGEGGAAGGAGTTSGLAGGTLAPEPPPPAAPPAPKPVRVGGVIKTPAVIHRVEPAYPNVAMMAQVQGTVILEVTVGADGCVQSVRVLSS